jgi:NADH-quinone oxidoreductase subunit C
MFEDIKGNTPSTPQPEAPKPAADQPAAPGETRTPPPAVKADEQVAASKSGDVHEGKDPAAVKPAPPAPAAAAPSPGAPQSGATKTPMTTDGTPAAGPTAAAPPKAAAPAAPAKPAVPAKPAGPTPQPWTSEMVTTLKGRFGSGIKEASSYVGQNYMVVEPSVVRDVLSILRDEERFDYCVDITAVHYPKRELQFDIVYILYSFPRNERIRVKTQIPDGAAHPSAVSIWPTANWLERECFDMFGIQFEGHPDLRRILLPDGWTGYPLRKEYGILQQDTDWVKANLGIESGQ